MGKSKNMRVFKFLVFVVFGVEAATSCRNIGTIKIAAIPKKSVATSGEFLSRFLTEVEVPVETIAAERLRVALGAGKYTVQLCPKIDTPESSVYIHTKALVYHSQTYPGSIDCTAFRDEASGTFFYTEEPFDGYPEELLMLYNQTVVNIVALDPTQYGKLASYLGIENLSRTMLIPVTSDEKDTGVKEAFDKFICPVDDCFPSPHNVMLLLDSTTSFSRYRPVISDAIQELNGLGVSTTLASFSDRGFYPATSGTGGYTFRLESDVGMVIPSAVLDVPFVSGGDEREDQLGAIVSAVDILKSEVGALKTVVLFTDSFPHSKGDLVPEGEADYRDVEFVLNLLTSESVYLVLVTPPELIEDYSTLIPNVTFVPIDSSGGSVSEYLKAIIQAQNCGDDWLPPPAPSVTPVRNRDAEIMFLLDRGGLMIPIESEVKEGTKAAVRKIVSEFFQSNVGLGLVADDPHENPYSNAIAVENLVPLTLEKNLVFYSLDRVRFSGGLGQDASLIAPLLHACGPSGDSGVWPQKAPESRQVLRACVLVTNSYCSETDMENFVLRKSELGEIVPIVLVEENSWLSCRKIEKKVVMESFDTRGHKSLSDAFDLAIERILGPDFVIPSTTTTTKDPSAGGEGGLITTTLSPSSAGGEGGLITTTLSPSSAGGEGGLITTTLSPSSAGGEGGLITTTLSPSSAGGEGNSISTTLPPSWTTTSTTFLTSTTKNDRLAFRLAGQMVGLTKNRIDAIVEMMPSDSLVDWGEFAKIQLDAMLAGLPV